MGDEFTRVAFFCNGALARRNACAIDEQSLHPMSRAGPRQRRVD